MRTHTLRPLLRGRDSLSKNDKLENDKLYSFQLPHQGLVERERPRPLSRQPSDGMYSVHMAARLGLAGKFETGCRDGLRKMQMSWRSFKLANKRSQGEMVQS